MKEIKSSYSRNLIRQGRRVGNTTRLCDYAIDLLFQGNVVIAIDHYVGDFTVTRNGSKRLLRMITDRLHNEHHIERNDIHIVDDGVHLLVDLIKIDQFGNSIGT